MPIGVIEEMGRRGEEELCVKWQIPNFPSLLLDGEDDDWYASPVFRFGDVSWILQMWPNWKREAGNPASGRVGLRLLRFDGGPPSTVSFSVGIRGSGGVEKSREGEKEFKGVDGYVWNDFCSRSDLLEHRTRLMPDDTLTIRCVLKKPSFAREDLLEKEVEVLKEQITTLQKTVENYELESQNYKKQINTLESEKSSIAEEYKGLLEERMTVVSGLEKVHLKDENSPSRSDTLSCDFSDLYADGASPNFVLECNGWSIPVNTFVLSVRSDVFRDMFRNLREDETGSADIEDLEVPVLMSMLKFLYCGKLEDVSEDTVADLYKAGHRYARSLKWACCRWMKTNLTQENCVTFLKVADSHSDRDLRAVVVSFIVRHPGVMKTAAWLSYSNEHPKLASDVQQAYISSIIP